MLIFHEIKEAATEWSSTGTVIDLVVDYWVISLSCTRGFHILPVDSVFSFSLCWCSCIEIFWASMSFFLSSSGSATSPNALVVYSHDHILELGSTWIWALKVFFFTCIYFLILIFIWFLCTWIHTHIFIGWFSYSFDSFRSKLLFSYLSFSW